MIEETGNVVIRPAKPFHEYTVSFLAYIMWDPVHMYNAVVNEWKDVEPQITFDVRQPKTRAHSMERLRRFLDTHAVCGCSTVHDVFPSVYACI